MNITLPKLVLKDSADKQAEKVWEEALELVREADKARLEGWTPERKHAFIAELLDVIQAALGALQLIDSPYLMGYVLQEHRDKLKGRGWQFDGEHQIVIKEWLRDAQTGSSNGGAVAAKPFLYTPGSGKT